jgi:hypothetical protein
MDPSAVMRLRPLGDQGGSEPGLRVSEVGRRLRTNGSRDGNSPGDTRALQLSPSRFFASMPHALQGEGLVDPSALDSRSRLRYES